MSSTSPVDWNEPEPIMLSIEPELHAEADLGRVGAALDAVRSAATALHLRHACP